MSLPIANQIRRLRFEHGEMTQSELAEKIGMTRQTVAAIEGLVAEEGLQTVGWRDVPVKPDVLGESARHVQPVLRQLFLADPAGTSGVATRYTSSQQSIVARLRLWIP